MLYSIQSTALTIDWSGFARVDGYYHKDDQSQHYGNTHLVLKPELQAMDGLSVVTRFDLNSFSKHSDITKDFLLSNLLSEQKGYSFINSKDSGSNSLSSLFFNISQLYIDYKMDFFQLRVGKAPYHFGLGTTYSAETDPLDYWVSSFYQVAVYFEQAQFYLQPAILHLGHLKNSKEFAAILQAGMESDKWKVEFLYHHWLNSSDIENSTSSLKDHTKDSFFEIFGTYKEGFLNNKMSVVYSLKDSDAIAVAYEGELKLPVQLSPVLRLKTGYVPSSISFHPNYHTALVLWHHVVPGVSGGDSYNAIPAGQLNDVVYFTPNASFNFVDKFLTATPSATAFYKLSDKSLHYELDLKATYQIEERFFIQAEGSLLNSGKSKWDYALSARAAVTF